MAAVLSSHAEPSTSSSNILSTTSSLQQQQPEPSQSPSLPAPAAELPKGIGHDDPGQAAETAATADVPHLAVDIEAARDTASPAEQGTSTADLGPASPSSPSLLPVSPVDNAAQASSLLRRASTQILPSSLSALVPSAAKIPAFPPITSITTSTTPAIVPARNHIPRSSILVKQHGRTSLNHLEWYEMHNGVPLAVRIPAPVSQKQKEREKQLEREARERERERELERERDKERSERSKQEERIWGIPKKALLLGLPEVNFNAQMAMLGGWGNGSGGPTASSTPSTPSKAFLKERERERLRQREREKEREAEEADEKLDPEELAALNAIINTRRSMAAAQALASGQVVLPRPRRSSFNASTSSAHATTPLSAPPALPLPDSASAHERSASRLSEGGEVERDAANDGRYSTEASSYERYRHDNITSSNVSLKSSATGVTTSTQNSHAGAGPAPSAMEALEGGASPQSPTSSRYVPKIRFAPLPLPPPVDLSPPLGTSVGGADDDAASSILDSHADGMESGATGASVAEGQSPATLDGQVSPDGQRGDAHVSSSATGPFGAGEASVTLGDGAATNDVLMSTPTRAVSSERTSVDGRQTATGLFIASTSDAGGLGSGASTMRQSLDMGAGPSTGSSVVTLGQASPSTLLNVKPYAGPSTSSSASSTALGPRKRPRFPRVDSEDSSRGGSSVSGRAGGDDDSELGDMDVDIEEGSRRRFSGYGKGKWYLMGMPSSVFKSMRRPGTSDSSRRRAFGTDANDTGESATGKLTRRLSTGGVTSPGEVIRKLSAVGPGTMSSASSAESQVTAPTSGLPGSLGSQHSSGGGGGGGFMSFFGLSDGDADDRERERGRPSLGARNSSSRASSRSRRRSGSRGSARSRDREPRGERDIDYFTDEEERARRRKLVRSVRPGGTGMVTLPDGTKIPARRVDTVANEDRSAAGAASGASALDEEFDYSQWGFAGLARRSAGLNAGTTTTTATTTGASASAEAPSPSAALPALTQSETADLASITPAADVIAARLEKKSAAGSAEEVKRKYAEAEALKAHQAETAEGNTSSPRAESFFDAQQEADESVVLQARRPSITSTVGATTQSERRAGLSDGDGDTTVTPHSTPKAQGAGSVLAPLTALSSASTASRSPGQGVRTLAPTSNPPVKVTATSADSTASGAPAGVGSGSKDSNGTGSTSKPAWPNKTTTPGLGLTLERAEIIRRRHEAEVAALGAEILANVKGPRKKGSAEDLMVAGSKEVSHDKEASKSSTGAGSGKDGAVLSKTKHDRVGAIFGKDKGKGSSGAAAAAAMLPSVPSSPGDAARSKNRSDPPRGRRMDGGHAARESRSSSLALHVEGSPASVRETKRGMVLPSTEVTPIPSPALGVEGTPRIGSGGFVRTQSPSPSRLGASAEMKPSKSAPQVRDETVSNASARRSSTSLASHAGPAVGGAGQKAKTRSPRSPSGRRISVDPKVSIPAPLDWLPRRPDARGHHVVPLPQLGVRPRRPREGRIWDGWGYFSESEGDDDDDNDGRGQRGRSGQAASSGKKTANKASASAAASAAFDSDEDEDEDDDLDPETIAAEDRKTAFQQARLTTKAAGQEIVHARASSVGGGRREPVSSAAAAGGAPSGGGEARPERRASAGQVLAIGTTPCSSTATTSSTTADPPRLRATSSAAALKGSDALAVPRRPRHSSSVSSLQGSSARRALSQSPRTNRSTAGAPSSSVSASRSTPTPTPMPMPSTVVRDDDWDDAELWSPSAMQSMTNSSMPAGRFRESAASASVRARAAREKRVRESKRAAAAAAAADREGEGEGQDALNIDYGWSAAHHPSLFDNR